MSVPRWREGVPSTLNVVQPNSVKALRPFPSWEWQTIGDHSKLQNVQTFEIDNQNRMWILDVGCRNFYSGTAPVVDGAPKLIIYDLESQEHHTFVFPDSVAPYSR